MGSSWSLLGRAEAAKAAGAKGMVFDWDKAARVIVERGAQYAEAGLSGDWDWTGGEILNDGKPVLDSYTYLQSLWATPMILIDGAYYECYIDADKTQWDSGTKWPQSALDILEGIKF